MPGRSDRYSTRSVSQASRVSHPRSSRSSTLHSRRSDHASSPLVSRETLCHTYLRHSRTRERSRTPTDLILSQMPLPLGYACLEVVRAACFHTQALCSFGFLSLSILCVDPVGLEPTPDCLQGSRSTVKLGARGDPPRPTEPQWFAQCLVRVLVGLRRISGVRRELNPQHLGWPPASVSPDRSQTG